MRIGAVSDSHGDLSLLKQAVERIGVVDMMLHAGDIYSDFLWLEKTVAASCFGVVGNCDYGLRTPEEQFIEIEGQKLLLVHGHQFGVKMTYSRLLSYAGENNCNAVIFGHTHEPLMLREEGILLFNPGSVSRPRWGNFSCGVLEIRDGIISGQTMEF